MIITIDFRREDNTFREWINLTPEVLLHMIKNNPQELINIIEEVQGRMPKMSGGSYGDSSNDSLGSYNFAIASSVNSIL